MKFTGVGVALVTPFKGKKVNFDVLKDLIDFHLKNKTDFLVILGSTAEAATLSLKEKKQIIDFVVKYANNKIPIVVGSGSNDTAASIAFSKYSEKAGADGLLVVTPYYNKPSQKGLIAHFKAIAKKVSLPIILYNVPSRTAVNLETKTVLELSKIDNIVGIKEASGNLTQVKEIIDVCGQDFVVLSGNDEQTLDVLKLGGHGTISVTANIIPGILASLIKDYFSGKNIDDEFNSFLPLHDAMFIETNPVVVKRALEHMGFVVGSPRLPLLKLEHKHDKILKEVLEKYKLVTND